MEELLQQLAQGQGIWTVLSVFLLIYTIKKNDKLTQRQQKREQEYQDLLQVLSEKYNILLEINNEVKELKNYLYLNNYL